MTPNHNSISIFRVQLRHPSVRDRWLPQRGWIRATLRKAEAARAELLEAYDLQRPPPSSLY
jgi:hypothetical protein